MNKRQELRVKGMGEPISHFTDAVRFGDILFVSGIVGIDEDYNVIGKDAATQTRQIFKNLKLVLDEAGATFADILKVNVYLLDINDRALINPVREEFFGSARPASTLLEVSKLALPDLKLEIECVVGLPSARP